MISWLILGRMVKMQGEVREHIGANTKLKNQGERGRGVGEQGFQGSPHTYIQTRWTALGGNQTEKLQAKSPHLVISVSTDLTSSPLST